MEEVKSISSQTTSSHPSSISTLVHKVSDYIPKTEIQQIEKAYQFSKKAHANQFRKTGESFIEHPLNVSHILADLKLDSASIIAGLLHDVVEDTDITLTKIKKEFGNTIMSLVDGLTKLSKIPFKSNYQQESENIRKMLIFMSRDIRVILVKLADRLHNMRTISPLSEERKLRICQETLDIYAPIAGRLGLYFIKVELEDLAFKCVYPEVYAEIFQQFESETSQREKYIQEVVDFLTSDLSQKTQIKFQISGRTKNMYSIYRKMQVQNVSYDQVYDIVAFRICTSRVHECYEILGWIHSLWKPIPARFKDFIAVPKSNNYQSLHTTVIGLQGKRMEIQIRTFDMHQVAEKGIAAHWRYKENSVSEKTATKEKAVEKFNWLQDLVDLHRQAKHSSEFLANMKQDLFESEIYVFTPKGNVKAFANGATPIDFAYAIHTDLGNQLKEAKVNNCIVPLKYKLQNGDVVEVSTSSKSHPKREWLDHCVTSKARSRIRIHIHAEERKMSIQLGTKLLEKELRSVGSDIDSLFKNKSCKKIMTNMGLNVREDVFCKIGYGKIMAKTFVKTVLGVCASDSILPTVSIKKKSKHSQSSIEVEGMGNVLVTLAKCCNPLPGEDILGYISIEKGITVHRCECKNILKSDSERFVEVDWKRSATKEAKHQVSLEIVMKHHSGVLKQVSHVFAERGINILDITIKSKETLKANISVIVEIDDIQHLRSTIRALEKLKTVYHVSRVVPG